MKEYFIRLVNYDRYANLLITKAIIDAGSPEKCAQLMAHLLAAQQIWLTRCKGEFTTGGGLWPDWKTDTFEQIIEENHKGWINFFNTLTPADIDQEINYKDLKGNRFRNKLSDILAHLINHGTHHRAQAGQQLKFAGVEYLPPTDYILYVRQGS